MGYMEIAILAKGTVRIKGKTSSLVVDPDQKERVGANGILLLGKSPEEIEMQEESVVVSGPGEYEIAGIKISGVKNEGETVYTIRVEGVELLLGRLSALDKMQHKLKDHNIVAVDCNAVVPASFITSLANNVIIFYGEKAEEVSHAFGKENIKQLSKYASTLEKLPTEVETILLANN